MSSKYKHIKIPTEVLGLIEAYYKEYSGMWLKDLNDSLHPEEKARFRGIAQGMKIMYDLLLTHKEEVVNAQQPANATY